MVYRFLRRSSNAVKYIIIMKEINYGIFCEDISQKTFIIEFLKIFEIEKQLYFVLNENFSYKYKGRPRNGIITNYVDVSIVGFLNFGLNILFVGLDYDDKDRTRFKEEYDKLQKKLPKQTINKTIIFFPVQAIEHWMLFIKYKIDNPKSTKNISNNIEKISRKDAKKEIYGTYKPNKIVSEEISSKITSQLNINWLKSKSESFRLFLNKLEKNIQE